MNRLRAPRWPTVAAVCAAITLAGRGSQVAGRTAGHAQTASATSHAASPRQRAAADADRIIADFRRPPGAVEANPIASLANPAVGTGFMDVATATRWWRVPGQPRAVLSWVRAHLPAGFTLAGSGSATFRNASGTLAESQGDAFALSPVPGVLPQRQLVVTAVPYRGQTALRTDAQVAWLPPRPAAERIPPGVRACPASFGGAMRLAFLARPGGRVLARFTAEYGGCGSVSVAIGGKNEPALSGWTDSGALLQDRVLAIAGVRWPHQPGAPAGVGN